MAAIAMRASMQRALHVRLGLARPTLERQDFPRAGQDDTGSGAMAP